MWIQYNQRRQVLTIGNICVRLGEKHHPCSKPLMRQKTEFESTSLKNRNAQVSVCQLWLWEDSWRPTTWRTSQHEDWKSGEIDLEYSYFLKGNSCLWIIPEVMWHGVNFFPFAFLPGLLIWIRCQAYDIQDGGVPLWKQLVAAFCFSVARAGFCHTLPNVLVDVAQNKHPGSDRHHKASSFFVKHGG